MFNIIFPHRAPAHGGVGTFQRNLENYFNDNNVSFSYKKKLRGRENVILVMGGTKSILWLLLMKLRGVKIIHRVDGKNWQYKLDNSISNKFKSYFRQVLVSFIRKYLADKIIYQSCFIRDWWQCSDLVIKDSIVIYNGTPDNIASSDFKDIDVICVEGSVNGTVAYNILKKICKYKVHIFGKYNSNSVSNMSHIFHGPTERASILDQLSSSKIFINLETNPPCPNSVIEALSFGLPVVSIKNGSIAELVGSAGVLIEQKNDPWVFDYPPELDDIDYIIEKVLRNYDYYSSAARKRYLKKFTIEKIGKEYLNFIIF